MVMEYVSGIKAAWDAAKIVKTATDSFEDAHLKLQIADLMSALSEAKFEAVENAERIVELENRLKVKDSMFFENGLYFRLVEGGEQDGPFCATCYDDKGKLIRLQNKKGCVGGDWKCEVCDSWFKLK